MIQLYGTIQQKLEVQHTTIIGGIIKVALTSKLDNITGLVGFRVKQRNNRLVNRVKSACSNCSMYNNIMVATTNERVFIIGNKRILEIYKVNPEWVIEYAKFKSGALYIRPANNSGTSIFTYITTGVIGQTHGYGGWVYISVINWKLSGYPEVADETYKASIDDLNISNNTSDIIKQFETGVVDITRL